LPRARHSFPTRRSSDLLADAGIVGDLHRAAVILQRDVEVDADEEPLVLDWELADGRDAVERRHGTPWRTWTSWCDAAPARRSRSDRKSTRLNSSHVKIS